MAPLVFLWAVSALRLLLSLFVAWYGALAVSVAWLVLVIWASMARQVRLEVGWGAWVVWQVLAGMALLVRLQLSLCLVLVLLVPVHAVCLALRASAHRVVALYGLRSLVASTDWAAR